MARIIESNFGKLAQKLLTALLFISLIHLVMVPNYVTFYTLKFSFLLALSIIVAITVLYAFLSNKSK
ncbi:hypothetical protein ACTHO0_18825 [Cytobacillus praedii]|uniref:hypothetical protein n=1 Tax=Cytobacillus praedii TaxID=1742358 RepID=UPI003F7EAA20